jgi:DNA replication ATP-dependent helicase Dna2
VQGEGDVIERDADVEDEQARRSFGSSDDFGDDDFDSEMVDVLDAPPPPVQQPSQAIHTTSYVTVPTEPIHPPPQNRPSTAAQINDVESEDEFGMDEDEDEFAADLEHVASMYDTRPIVSPSQGATYDDVQANPSAVANLSATVPVIDLVDDDSDEFGDDIDVDVFAAAEVAATQPSANTVRRTRTFP